MAESITLTTPQVTQVTNTSWRIGRVLLDIDAPLILVTFRGSNGEQQEWRTEGDTALQRIKALNTANLSTKSLQRRIMETAISDGVFSGTVSGLPDA